jgi:hypothetical protein
MNIANILTEKLPLFINKLRSVGYNISTAQFIAIQNLIFALAKQGKLPPKLAQFNTLFAPILCHSQKEQQAFGSHFDEWVQTIEKPEEISCPDENAISDTLPPVRSTKKWVIITTVIVIAMLIGSFVFYQFFPRVQETPPIDITEPSPPSPELPVLPEPETIPKSSEPQQLPDLPKETSELPEPQTYFWWMMILVLLLIPLSRYLWRHFWRHFWRRYLVRKYTSIQPDIKKLSVETAEIEENIFQPFELSHSAQQLRKHISVESIHLDITATIEKSIEAGGWFTPVRGTTKRRPEYLVLIDRLTFKDHQTQLVDTLINQLIDEEVLVNRYYFDVTPRRCYPEDKHLAPLTLTELAAHYPAHKLLIFSDGNGFINPITGKIVDWINQLSIWTHRTLFTLEAPEQWGYREHLLKEEADFLIMPANEGGLKFLVEQINANARQSYHSPLWESRRKNLAFPEVLNENFNRWLERHAPDAEVLKKLLTQMKLFLGEEAYDWFCACAVYPELHWQVTLYLRKELLTESALLEDFMKLARLPWFRYGYMPDWLREPLVKNLEFRHKDKEVHFALEKLLETIGSDKADFELGIASEPKRHRRHNPLKEHVFFQFMADRLAVKVPKNTGALGDFKLPIIYFLSKFSSLFYTITPKLNVISKLPILPVLFFSLLSLAILGGVFWLSKFFPSQTFFMPAQFIIPSWATFVILFYLVWLLGKLFSYFTRFTVWNKFWNKLPRLYNLASNLFIGLGVYLLAIIFPAWTTHLEDSSMDFAMQVRQDIIPSAKEKGIPPFVFLDIDDQTHKMWGEPLFTPRNKVKQLIDVAVKGEARLVIVDVSLSQKTPIDGLKQFFRRSKKNLRLHPYDQELQEYIAGYKKQCENSAGCSPIILARVFRPLPDFVEENEKLSDLFRPNPEPVREVHTGFLEEAVKKSAPYVQWASPLFWQSYDNVIRRWLLWQSVCTDGIPDIIPSIPLSAVAIIRLETLQQAQEKINTALADFKPKYCSDSYMPKLVSSNPIKIAGELEITEGIQSIYQRIMYNMPWNPPQNVDTEKFTVRYFLLDYDRETQEREVILTVFSAQPYLNSPQANAVGVLKDKIVVIGGSYGNGGDIHSTPLGAMPGALILINAIHSLLQYGDIKHLSNWENLGMTVLLILTVSLTLSLSNSFWIVILSGIIVVALAPVSVFLLGEGVWIKFTLPLLAVHINQIASHYQQMAIMAINLEQQEQSQKEYSAKLAKEIEHSLTQSLTRQINEVLLGDNFFKMTEQYNRMKTILMTAKIPPSIEKLPKKTTAN